MPSQGYGHRQVFGFAEESTYGTRVAPTKFLEIMPGGYGIGKSLAPINSQVGNTVKRKYPVPGKKSVGGPVSFPMVFQGAELLLKHATCGTPSSTQIGTTGVYTHVFVLGESMPTGLSFYHEPDQTGIAQAYAHTGMMLSKLSFKQDKEKHLLATIEALGQDQSDVSAASVSYPTFKGVDWSQVTTLTIGGTAYSVNMAEWTLENPLAEDLFKLGSLTRVGLGRSGERKVTGKLQLQYDNKALYNLLLNQTEFALAAEWTGGIAAGSTAYKMRITCPRCIATGEAPKADGLGPMTMDLAFEAYYDITNTADEIKIELDNLLTSI